MSPVLRLSDSALNSLNGCKRKFEFQRFYPQKPHTQEYWDTMTGKALHAGQQKFLETRNEHDSIAEMLFNFDFRAKSNKDWEPKSLEACYATLNSIFSFYRLQPEFSLATVKTNKGIVPATEIPFQINLFLRGQPVELEPGYPIIFVGKIDDVLINKQTGKFLVEDLKTTRAQYINDPEANYTNDEQPIAYAIVLQRALGLDIKELVFRYVLAYVDLRQPKVFTAEFTKSEDQIRDWAQGLLLNINYIKQLYQMKWFPRNGKYCYSYGQRCQFFGEEICGSRDDEYLQMYFGLNGKEREPFIPVFTLDLDLAEAA